ncbi:M15 family metallopeptidase [Spirilliplanes yamanashiensis]|nr:M15 family metallopeptidase [Spirilliplanes yamanashiensis]MDP9819377.1 hypothetical protein [Spirilliplanes yamanashiensis]
MRIPRPTRLPAALTAALLAVPVAAVPAATPAAAAPPPAAAAPPPVAAAPTLAVARNAPVRPPYHVVRPGQTLRSVAKVYGVGWKVIAAWNGLRRPYTVHVDDVLRLNRQPGGPLPAFRTRVERVTPQMVNWNPALRCPIWPVSLRRVWVFYVDFAGNRRIGSIIMHRLHVTRTQRIFRELYQRRFRVQAMAPASVNLPGGTDYSAITSGWECRRVSGSNVWSQHAYGTAIDLNPVQNPMIKRGVVTPSTGRGYVGRSRYGIGMVHAAGAVPVFTGNGFPWGGRWRTMKDYMHFAVEDR